MPQIPYSGVPAVGGDFIPKSTVTSRASAASFGGIEAEAAGGLARTISHAGDELFTRAMAMQKLDEQAAASDAVSALTEKIGLRLEDFRTLSGSNAKAGYQPFVADIDKFREEGEAGLTSDYARQLYRQESRQLHSRTVLSAAAHAGNEFKNYQIGSTQATINNAIDQSMIDPRDDKAFKSSLDKIKQSAAMMRQLKGWSDEQEKDYLGTSQSKLVFERATTLARTDPATAQKVLDDAVKSGYISGEESGRAQEFIRQKRNHITSRIEADALLDGQGNHFSAGSVPIGDAREAIATVEASGNYEAIHPVVKTGRYAGQRALGRYGIMPGNLPGWLKEAGMPNMTPEEFVRDHAAQDKLFNFKFGQLMREHGSASRAAMVWFTGSPEPKPSANDGHTSAPEYLKRFNAALGRNASPERRYEVAKARAQELAPDDPEFEFQFTNRVESAHRTQTRAYNEELRQNIDVIESAIVPAKDGKLVTSIDDVTDPEVHKAWDWMQMHDPKKIRQYNELFARNAKGDYTATEENQAEYHRWLGRLTDPTMSDAEREKAMNADYATMHMPAANRDQLNRIRNKLIAGYVKDPNVSHAMQVLEPRLVEARITKKDDEDNYYLLKGILHDVMQNEIARAKRPLKDEEIIQMGNRLLREQVIKKGWFWDSKGPAFQTEVPDEMKKVIIDRYINKYGDAPSEQTIRRLWAVRMYNELYAKGASNAEKR